MIRDAAARALMVIDKKGLVEVLRKNVSDSDASIRAHAARFLGELLGAESLTILLLLSRDPESQVRDGAAAGLSKVADERAGQELMTLAGDSAPEVRRTAVEGIGTLRYVRAVPDLAQRLLFDDSDLVRADIARALGVLRDKRATSALCRVLVDRGIGVFAALSLGQIGDESAIGELAAMFKRLRGSQYFRDWPVVAIGRIGGATAVQALNELLMTEDPEGRKMVIQALPLTNHDQAVFGLLVGLAENHAVVRMQSRERLSTLARQTLVSGLLQAIAQSNPVVRREALLFLPAYVDKQKREVLEDLATNDTDPQVLVSAGEALEAFRRRWE
jgi:HEAT repeat protein